MSTTLLLLTSACLPPSRLIEIERNLGKSRSSKSGPYWTWIDKANNQQDYVVNLNIRFLRAAQGIGDTGLDRYLTTELDSFLTNGSHYYSYTLFPRLLATVYRDILPADIPSGFNKTLEKLSYSDEALLNLAPCHSLSAKGTDWHSLHISSYFNARDANYQSPILDKILGAYIGSKTNELKQRAAIQQDRPK
jgi:hypothetical protein